MKWSPDLLKHHWPAAPQCLIWGLFNIGAIVDYRQKKFEKCWKKVNGGTWADNDENKLKKNLKYHAELVHREATKYKTWDFALTVIWTTFFSLLLRSLFELYK